MWFAFDIILMHFFRQKSESYISILIHILDINVLYGWVNPTCVNSHIMTYKLLLP